MQEPVKALTQSYSRTKATNYEAFQEIDGAAHQLVEQHDLRRRRRQHRLLPRRTSSRSATRRFDWTKPVDGSDPATEWEGLHSVDESPNVLNPKSGWLYNTNNWPWSAAGRTARSRRTIPPYVDCSRREPARHARHPGARRQEGLHARLAASPRRSTATCRRSTQLLPPLFEAYDALPAASPLKAKLAEQIAALRAWDCRWSARSVPTSLAVFWGEELWRRVPRRRATARHAGLRLHGDEGAPRRQRLEALAAAVDKLTADFGNWETPWGEINRFQRLTGDIVQPFDDAAPSIPVPFTSARWGSLASFGARAYPGHEEVVRHQRQQLRGGRGVRRQGAREGGHRRRRERRPESPHFNDQAERYATGNLRDVYFYPEQLKGHTERTYQPGEK